jgi:hypothetical protein
VQIPSTGISTLAELGVTASAAEVNLLDGITAIDTDTALAANSDTRLPTQKAVKAYADALIAANDAMVFRGVIACDLNPNYPSANCGDTYRVSTPGHIGGYPLGPHVEAGDILICLTDNTASGNHSAVGANWNIIQANLDGALTTLDIGVVVQAYTSALNDYAYAADAAARRALIGVVIGTDVQAYDAALTALAAGSNFVQFTGPTTSTKVFTLPNSAAVVATSASALTSGRVPYATTGGQLLDSSAFTFDTTNGITLPGTNGTYGITVGNGTNGVLITRDSGYRTFVGGQVNHQIPYNSHVVFNAVQAATNFTIHTDTLSATFYVDGTNNRVSIGGTTNAGYMLQVNGTLNVTGAANFATASAIVDIYQSGGGWRLNSSNILCGSSGAIAFTSGSNASGSSQDTSLHRHAAGVFRVGSGSTGKGDLLLGPSSSTKDAAAALQIDSTTQGFYPPRHTTAQRGAVGTPPEGLFVHDTNLYRPYVRSNAAWRPVAYQTDRVHGNGAYVNGVYSHAYGDFMSFTNFETGIGVLTNSGETAAAIVREDGLFLCPDDGLVADQDQGTQIATLVGVTNDNTPQVLDRNAWNYTGLPIPADYAGAFDGVVIGVDTTNYECCSYQIKGMVKNVAGTLSLLGGNVSVLHEEDASWTVTLAVNSTSDCLEVTVTGDATNQVRWTASLRFAYNSMLSYLT